LEAGFLVALGHVLLVLLVALTDLMRFKYHAIIELRKLFMYSTFRKTSVVSVFGKLKRSHLAGQNDPTRQIASVFWPSKMSPPAAN
jgi:hypothetical protein